MPKLLYPNLPPSPSNPTIPDGAVVDQGAPVLPMSGTSNANIDPNTGLPRGQINFSQIPVGQVYGNDAYGQAQSQQATYYQRQANQPDANDPAVQAQIRAQTLAGFQAEIDATNSIYADKLRSAAVVGAGRLGQATSGNARAGLIGSDFGNAQYNTVQQGNTDVQNSIQNEKNAAVNAILTKSNDQARADIAAKVAAKQQGLDAYVKFLGDSKTRQETNAQKAAAVLLSQNHDTKTLDPTALQSVLDNYGITREQLDMAYNEAKPAYDAATAEAKAKAAKGAADLANTVAGTANTQANMAQTTAETAGLPAKQAQDAAKAAQSAAESKANIANTNASTAKLYQDVAKAKAELVGSGLPSNYKPGANPIVDSWANRIQNSTAKITEIPASQSALRNQVTVALDAMGNSLDGKPTTTELGKAAINTAKGLLDKFNAGKGTSAVGTSAAFNSLGYGFIPGTDRANFKIDFQSLKDQLSLEGVKYLKGQGQVSDAERALLASAVTKLNLSQSEGEFKKTLEGIIGKLEGTGGGILDAASTDILNKYGIQ